MDLVQDVRRALTAELGPAAADIRICVEHRRFVVLAGTVEDQTARGLALRAAARTAGVEDVRDELCVKPDLAAEAQARETEFRTEADARAATTGEFDKIT